MDNRKTRRKRVRRFIAYSLVIMTAIISCLAAWGVYQWKHQPAYWTANQSFLKNTPSEEVDRIAWETENTILNLLSTTPQNNSANAGSSASRTASSNNVSDKNATAPLEKTINLTTDQINAWLDRRLPAWASNLDFKLPSEFSHYMFHPENGQITMAFDYSKGDISNVFSLVFNITMISEGQALVHLSQVRGGSLTSPVSPSKLASLFNDEKLQRLINEMVQGKKVDMTFPHPVDARLKITVKKLAVHGNGVIADVVTK